jgi:hypothetical protein
MKENPGLPKRKTPLQKQCLFAVLFVSFVLQAGNCINAQEASTNSNDGPYVLYSNDSIIVKTIFKKRSRAKAVTQYYSIAEKVNLTLHIPFSDHPDWSFDVKLQPTLAIEPAEYPQPSRLLALSDIEGEFAALRELLLANKVIDDKYNWIFGNGHVVICGDLFDRGLNVLEELWLLYKLEQDAKAKGGYLHTVLGNHDIMNMSGDIRYVQKKYFDNAKRMGVEYERLFDANTELGRWLRSKNIIEKIGDNLCLHAGVSRKLNELQMPLEKINGRSRPFYDKGQDDVVYDTDSLNPFYSDTTSPFWYRGYFIAPKAPQSQVDSTLDLYKCKQIIVGHTIAPTNVAAYYQNKVFGIDVNQHEGKHEGILFENQQWFIVNTNGKKKPLIE